MGKRVFLGMSGGVDSALAAALLVEQGYEVQGIYMRNWSRDLPGFACPWANDLADAERVAYVLGIDLDVWDCEQEYQATVVDYLVDAYARGFTPNPDVMCNQTIKFGTFAEKAFEQGADLIATGHYARVAPPTQEDGQCRLLRSTNEHKDQTYFLWRVPARAFSRTLFPVGDIATKDEVRAMCAQRGLGVENKPDSDGICFVGPVGLRTFLLDTLERRAGDVVEWETGKVLGRHDGAFLFTVGQRRGLDLGGGPARYVVETNTRENVVYVTADRMCPGLWTNEIELEDVRWIGQEPPYGATYAIRTRHTGELRKASVRAMENDGVRLRFEEPLRTVAPGQSAVIYDGVECLGGGLVAQYDTHRPQIEGGRQ